MTVEYFGNFVVHILGLVVDPDVYVRHICPMLLASPHVLQLRKDDHVTVQADPVSGSIAMTWQGFAPSHAYRGILDDALSNVCLHKLCFWFSDFRGMNAILRQDERWTVEEWFPRVVGSGLQRMAIVMSDDFFNRMAVERIMAEVLPSLPFAVSYFEGPAQARAWMLDRDVKRM